MSTSSAASGSPVADRTVAALEDALAGMRRSMADADFAARHFRDVLDRVVSVARVAALLDGGEPVAAEHLLHANVFGEPPHDDSGYGQRVDELASAE